MKAFPDKWLWYLLGVMMLVVTGCDTGVDALQEAPQRAPMQSETALHGTVDVSGDGDVFTLFAGQDKPVGTVSVSLAADGEQIKVTFRPFSGVCFQELHADAGYINADGTVKEIPVNKKGNPQIGRFEASNTLASCSGEEQVLAVLKPSSENKSGGYIIAAHAVVQGGTDYGSSVACGFLYGIEHASGDLFMIDPIDKTFQNFFSTGLYGTNVSWPNGLATDLANGLLYYVNVDHQLYTYDFSGTQSEAFMLNKPNAGATFANGSYWYIPHAGEDDLIRVNPATGDETTIVDDFTGDENKSFYFGDLAYKDGFMYFFGSDQNGGGIKELSKINLEDGTYTVINDDYDYLLQIAFGPDGKLYGHSIASGTPAEGEFYALSLAGGGSESLGSVNGLKFNDLATALTDCEGMGEETAWAAEEVGKELFVRSANGRRGSWATYFYWMPSTP